MMKLNTTPGPAIFLATIPATRYMPVPQHEPTPSDVKSSVVRHFYDDDEGEGNVKQCQAKKPHQLTVNFGFVLFGSSPCIFLKSFVRMSLEKSVMPVPPPGSGIENFMVCGFSFKCLSLTCEL